MGLDMAKCFSAMALIMVWLCVAPCLGQTTPRTVVTRAYFNKLLSAVPAGCEGKSFYSYNDFISAAEKASGFGTTGSEAARKREIAAFLANVMHETGALCYVSEKNKSNRYCEQSPQWSCAPGKSYYGRGPLQLTWNYNYGAAGKAIGFDGINNPDIVSQNPTISFKASFWFWMKYCHNAIVSGRGFGATIRAINSLECNGGNPSQVQSRVMYYRRFCSDFRVDPGSNISC